MCFFFTSDVYKNYNLWSCQKVRDPLFPSLITFILDLELYFIGKLLVFRWELTMDLLFITDLFLFCYEIDFMKSLSRENQADIIEAFTSTSRYLDNL